MIRQRGNTQRNFSQQKTGADIFRTVQSAGKDQQFFFLVGGDAGAQVFQHIRIVGKRAERLEFAIALVFRVAIHRYDVFVLVDNIGRTGRCIQKHQRLGFFPVLVPDPQLDILGELEMAGNFRIDHRWCLVSADGKTAGILTGLVPMAGCEITENQMIDGFHRFIVTHRRQGR